MILATLCLSIPLFSADSTSGYTVRYERDTAFYTLQVPPDLDMPSTPRYTCAVTRTAQAKAHVIELPNWGTSTYYAIIGDELCASQSADTQRRIRFSITNWTPGVYTVTLFACGNGGSFSLTLR